MRSFIIALVFTVCVAFANAASIQVQTVPGVVTQILGDKNINVDPKDRAISEILIDLLVELKETVATGSVDAVIEILIRASNLLGKAVPLLKDPEVKHLLIGINVQVDSVLDELISGNGDLTVVNGLVGSIEGSLSKFVNGLGDAVSSVLGGVVGFVSDDVHGMGQAVKDLVTDVSHGDLIGGALHVIGDVAGGKLNGVNSVLDGLTGGLKALF